MRLGLTYTESDGAPGGYYSPAEPTDIYQEPIKQEPIPVKSEPGIIPLPYSDVPLETVPVTTATRYSKYVTGYIVDSKTGQPVSATVEIVFNGQPVPGTKTVTQGTYEAWTDQEELTSIFVRFTAKGYATQNLSFAELLQAPDVLLSKAFPWEYVALVIGAVWIYRRKTKKVGKLSTGDIIPIMLLVGGVIGFSFIKQILEFLGIWKDQDEKDLDAAATDPGSFWNPNYWRTIKPAGASWSYAITDTTARAWAEEIYNSFHWYNDCEDCVIAVCKRCRTKANFSFLADIFQQKYGQDLLTFLRGGWWPQDRLSDADTNTINQYITNLPNY